MNRAPMDAQVLAIAPGARALSFNDNSGSDSARSTAVWADPLTTHRGLLERIYSSIWSTATRSISSMSTPLTLNPSVPASSETSLLPTWPFLPNTRTDAVVTGYASQPAAVPTCLFQKQPGLILASLRQYHDLFSECRRRPGACKLSCICKSRLQNR